MKTVLVSLFLFGTAVSAQSERIWLVIVASDPKPAGIAVKAKKLFDGKTLVFQTSDCGDKKKIYAMAARIESTDEDAYNALQTVRETVPNAYIKMCEVKPSTLLNYRIPAVDPSIAEVPVSAVNWEDKDRVSTVTVLPDGRSLVIARYFENAPDDPLEGRRERVLLVDSSHAPVVLVNNCIDMQNASTQGTYLTFQCARVQAGDNLLHTVLLFNWQGNKVKEIEHCRNPRFQNPRVLSCDAESVNSDGELKLKITPYGFD